MTEEKILENIDRMELEEIYQLGDQDRLREYYDEKNKDQFKSRFGNKYFAWGFTAFATFVSCMFFYYLFINNDGVKKAFSDFLSIMMPVLFGLGLAYILCPIMNFIENKLIMPISKKLGTKNEDKTKGKVRLFSVILTDLLFILLIYAMIAMLISQIIPSITNFVGNLDGYLNNFDEWSSQMLEDNPELEVIVSNYLSDVSKDVSDSITTAEMESRSANSSILSQVFKEVSTGSLSTGFKNSVATIFLHIKSGVKVFWNFIIGIIISIYLLVRKEKFIAQSKKIMYSLLDRNSANKLLRGLRFSHKVFIGFFGGKIVDSFIIGLICLAGTTLLRIPYAPLISLIIGVTNIIPFFGPFLGAIPSALLIFLVDVQHPLQVVYFIIFILVLQQFDGTILAPKILGDSTGLDSFWIIFAITIFGGIWGVFGMLIGVPIFAVIYAGIRYFVNKKLKKKKLIIDSDYYLDLEKYNHYLEKVTLDGRIEENPYSGMDKSKDIRQIIEKQKNTENDSKKE